MTPERLKDICYESDPIMDGTHISLDYAWKMIRELLVYIKDLEADRDRFRADEIHLRLIKQFGIYYQPDGPGGDINAPWVMPLAYGYRTTSQCGKTVEAVCAGAIKWLIEAGDQNWIVAARQSQPEPEDKA